MSTWQPNQPTSGYYPGEQDPRQPYYASNQKYGTQPGYPQQPVYPPQTGYPTQPPTYPSPPPPYEGLNATQPPINPGFAPPPPGFTSPNSQQGMYGSSYADEPLTSSDHENFQFSDKTIRHGFIRKVYSILMCQLAITTVFIAVFTYHTPTKKFLRNNPGIFIGAFICTFVILIAMSCCQNVRRKSPMNMIFLLIFTVAESIVLGAAAATYERSEVLMAAGICAAVCFGLTLFAFQTKWDFTVMGGVLFVALIILVIFGIVAMVFPGKTIAMVYASLGALLFCVYLIYDTQMIIGGGKYSVSPEEYVFAALSLYLDMVNIFIYILTIIGLNRD